MKTNNKTKIEKVINIVLNFFIVLFGIVLIVTIYCNVQTKFFGKDYADFFGFSMFEVQTGSMADTINVGDWIIVKSKPDYKVKDVITYKYNNDYITHRIVESYNGTYVTKGDANNAKDMPINKDQIVGKVVKVFASLGILKKTMFNPLVLLSVIITILLFNYAFKNNNNNNKLREKLNKPIKVSLPKIKIKENVKMKRISNKNIQQKTNIKEIKSEIEETETTKSDSNDIVSSYVPVDISEIDSTFLEIAETEMEEPISILKKDESVGKEEKADEEPTLTKINLDLLEGNKSKKSKNIIEKVISIKIEELNEILNIFDDDGRTFTNEPTIKNNLLTTYIDARYYNYLGGSLESTSKKVSINIEKSLKAKSLTMINNYKGSDLKYSDKVNRFLEMFILLAKLDEAKYLINDNKARNEFYKKEITKFSKGKKWNSQKIKSAINDLVKIQRNYIGILEYLSKKLESNTFKLSVNKLTSHRNMFGVSLEHSIEFSKVYSDYIIDKTYNEGVIAEDKTVVLLTLLSVQIINDMINNDFNKKYIFFVPETLYSKEKKLERILKSIDDEYAKESIMILVKYSTLLKNKSEIKKLRKSGYSFALIFDKETTIDEKNYKDIYLSKYIFVDKKVVNVVKMISKLPDDIVDKIIYEDIASKIGDFGGEH